MTLHAVQLGPAEDGLAALGIPPGGDLGHQGVHLLRGRRFRLGFEAGGLAQDGDERVVRPAKGVDRPERQPGAVGGRLAPGERGGQLVGPPLAVEEGGHQGGDVLDPCVIGQGTDGLPGRRVNVESGQRGDGQGADGGRPVGRGQGFDRTQSRFADRGQGVERGGADLAVGRFRPGDVRENLDRRLRLPEARQANGCEPDGRTRLRFRWSDQLSEARQVDLRPNAARQRGIAEHFESLEPDGSGEAVGGGRAGVEVSQVVGRPALADDVDNLTHPLLGGLLEQLDVGALRPRILLSEGGLGEADEQKGGQKPPRR